MTKQEATRLAKAINESPYHAQVVGFRRYGRGSWALDVKDVHAPGYTFSIARIEDWVARIEDMEYWQAQETLQEERR